ncbi:Pentatricopeptide repeat-containing protein [Vigna angularis]|uniref:Pentatricopeptide repeat-containing protein n=1 Tax=Phaseolus angularis TaxID=3914 RepID=A0A8T0KDI7_PHAAN|nr:Pentatricopeptide repeat-containing protein [Vigna angularis]
MVIPCFFQTNSTRTKHAVTGIYLFFRIQFSNWTIKPMLTRTQQFHSQASLEFQNNRGFCFQDCVFLFQHLRDHKDVKCGRILHSLLVKSALFMDVFIQNNMIRFYGDIGEVQNARKLFDEIPQPSLVSWTSLVSCYVHAGQHEMGLSLFRGLCRSGVRPNEFGFSVALKACKETCDAVMGKLIHGLVIKSGFDSHRFCSALILHMYGDCGDIKNSRKVFDGVCYGERCEALWNTLLNAYVKVSDVEGSLKLFHEMGHSSVSRNHFTYTIIVKLCADVLDVELGRSLHGQIMKIGIENDVVVGGTLIDCYVKLQLLDDARKIFQVLDEKDNVAVCALLAGFNQVGKCKEGLALYVDFLSGGNKPDPFTCASVVSLCSNLETQLSGSQIHCGVIKLGFMLDSYLGSAFINMYGNFGMVSDAYRCFLEVCNKNEICVNAMINTLIFNSYDLKAIELFCGMREVGIAQSSSSISYCLRACGNLFLLKDGRSFHSLVIKIPFEDDWHFVEALGIFCDMLLYSKPSQFTLVSVIQTCTEMKAIHVFLSMKEKDLISWSVMLTAWVQNGYHEEALKHFAEFQTVPIFQVDESILSSCISTAAGLAALDIGKCFHSWVIKVGLEVDLHMPSVKPDVSERDSEPFEEGIEVAWNQVKLRNFSNDLAMVERLYFEVRLLRSLTNKNIISLYSVWRDEKHNTLNFLIEVCTSGNLREYKKKHMHVSMRALKKWSKQILEGLNYLHVHDPSSSFDGGVREAL